MSEEVNNDSIGTVTIFMGKGFDKCYSIIDSL
jgi:hypothetical protein